MNNQQYETILGLLTEIKTIIETDIQIDAPLIWWKSTSTGMWWLSSCVGYIDDALYNDTGPTYYPNRNDTWIILSSTEDLFPLEARIGMIIMHAKLNNINIPPFPWDKL